MSPRTRRWISAVLIPLIGAALLSSGSSWAAAPHAPDATMPLSSLLLSSWNADSGLPQSSALALAQDQQGYLWIGTEDGLARFDGSSFIVHDRKNTPQLRNHHVRALLAARDGSLWVGTGSGLRRKVGDRWFSYSEREGLSHPQINAIHETRSGELWIGTHRGLNRIGREGVQTFTSAQGLPSNLIWSIAETGDGVLWIATEGGLARYRDGSIEPLENPRLAGVPVRALEPAGDVLWAGTRGAGLARVEADEIRFLSSADGLPHDDVYSITVSSNGTLWIGTNGGGIARIHQGTISVPDVDSPLAAGLIWSLLEDSQANLWAGTASGGLHRLRVPRVRTISTGEGLSVPIALAVTGATDGAVWIGTAGGGVNRMKDGQIQTWGIGDGLPSGIVLALAPGDRGSMWVGTSAGLVRVEPDGAASIEKVEGLSAQIIRSVLPEADGTLWVGTQGGGLDHLTQQGIRRYGAETGLTSEVISVIRRSRDGHLLVGTETSGLFAMQDGRFRQIPLAGLRDVNVASLHEERSGDLWIATAAHGLVRVRPNGLSSVYSSRDGLLDDALHAVVGDAQGRLWLTTNEGVFSVSILELERFDRDPSAPLGITTYGTRDGMRDAECNGGVDPAAWVSPAGRIHVPTIDGLVVLNPAKLTGSAAAPTTPIVFDGAAVDGRAASATSPLVLPATTRNVEIRYNQVDLYGGELLRFKYMLEGFDEQWTFAGTRRSAFYTNLTAGDYRLLVSTTSGGGDWSAPAALDVRVLRPFHQTWLFRSLIAAVVALVLFLMYRGWLSRLRNRERFLVLQLHERKRAEHAIRASEERFRSLIENASDLITTLTSDGRFGYVSPSIRRVLGYEPVDLDDAALDDLLHPDDRFSREELLEELQQRHSVTRTARVRHHDGSWRSLEMVITSGPGQVEPTLILNCRDITERLHLERQLSSANRLNSLGRLAATIAHEVNNVLMGIQPFAEITRREAGGNQKLLTAANQIEKSVVRGQEISRQILRFTRPADPVVTTFGVREWLTDLLPELHNVVRNIALRVSVEPADLAIEADQNQLTQVLTNLVINARDAIGSDGVIAISATPDALPGSGSTETYVRLSVKDNGSGIASDLLAHIFEPLFTTKGARGTGLGLAVAHQIIERHGGQIYVESEVGVGTSFHIFLRRMELATKVSSGAADMHTEAGSTGPGRVLLVEDDEIVAAGIAEMLTQRGAEVAVVSSGAEAFRIVSRFVPDLLVLDIRLREEDGVELYHRISQKVVIPVVFSSGHENEARLEDLMALPYVAFLLKPYDSKALFAAIERVLSGYESLTGRPRRSRTGAQETDQEAGAAAPPRHGSLL